MPDTIDEVQQIVAALAEARCRGEGPSDEEVLDSHPALREALLLALPFANTVAEAHRRSIADGSDHDAFRLMSDEELEAPIDIPCGPVLPTLVGYALNGEAGRGGQAVVYRGTHTESGEDVAVKVLHGGQHATGSSASRFRREVKILLRLRHPNVVGITDHGHTAGGLQFLVMPFIAGRPLDEHAATLAGDDAAIARLFATVAEAVDAVHRAGVIHRDLKPSNVRVDALGVPHVLDFGLASSAAAADLSRSLTGPGQILGSLPWASPEQARGEVQAVDARSDVYAIGLMLCRAISTGGVGAYPVDGPAHETIKHILRTRPRVTGRRTNDPLAVVTLRCLAKRQADRYPTAGALAADLRRVAGGQLPDARCRRAFWKWALVGVIAVPATIFFGTGRGSRAVRHDSPTAKMAMGGWPTCRSRSGLTYVMGRTHQMTLFWITPLPISWRLLNKTLGHNGGGDDPAQVDARTAQEFCRIVSASSEGPCRLPLAEELAATPGHGANERVAGNGPEIRPFRVVEDFPENLR